MSNRVILRQLALAVCIFVCITVINELETPWSNNVEDFLRFSLSEESNWKANAFLDIDFGQSGVGDSIKDWTEEMTGSLQERLEEISAQFRDKVTGLITRWVE